MKRGRRGYLYASLFLAVCLCLSLGSILISRAWAQGQGEGKPRKIVVFQETFVNQPAQEVLLERFGGVNIKPLPLVNGVAVCLPPAAQARLNARPEVLRIDDDAEVHALDKPPSPPGQDKKPPKEEDPEPEEEVLPWGVDRIDAEYAWLAEPGYTGVGVNVAVVDTGIDHTHPDLAVAGGVNVINLRKDYKDDNGHGTHVAGIIAALDNDIGVVGVAPEASLYGVKVLDRRGSGWLSDVIAGIDWCVNNNDVDIDIVNLSLGLNSDIQSLEDACVAAKAAGLILVAAAGNDGGAVHYPAAYDSVIAVSAVDSSDSIAAWSSYGPEVELCAPGVDIYSTYKGGGYAVESGTSMAAPHVAGTLALNPDGDIFGTADYLGDPDYYGDGLVDAEEAATGAETGDDLLP